MTRTRLLAVALFGLLCAGCGTRLRAQARTVHDELIDARAHGAYRCAPRELALGESHLDYAETQLDAGYVLKARHEVDLAGRSAKQALAVTRSVECNPAKVLDTDGDGIPDKLDKCPTQPEDRDGYQDEDGCPDPDNDLDGIPDKVDQCPNEPEDRDGFQDEDGCPDPDNDRDGVPDQADKCPNQAGPKSNGGCPVTDTDGDGVPDALDKCPTVAGPADNDGCPKQKLVVVTKQKIELKQKVHFATNRSRIKSDSFALLNEVADALKARPDLHVRIEGHTDARGSIKHNMKLSQARAQSVRAYLVAHGVDPSRMEARGYGPTRPIAENRTAAGREQNRRVEFVITAR